MPAVGCGRGLKHCVPFLFQRTFMGRTFAIQESRASCRGRARFFIGREQSAAAASPGNYARTCGVHGAPEPAATACVARLVARHGRHVLVFNHALWDEKAVGRDRHDAACRELRKQGKGYLQLIELNGLRPRQENEAARALAEAHQLPAISGGDRHGIEPNANPLDRSHHV